MTPHQTTIFSPKNLLINNAFYWPKICNYERTVFRDDFWILFKDKMVPFWSTFCLFVFLQLSNPFPHLLRVFTLLHLKQLNKKLKYSIYIFCDCEIYKYKTVFQVWYHQYAYNIFLITVKLQVQLPKWTWYGLCRWIYYN